jgi:hypothetical protein
MDSGHTLIVSVDDYSFEQSRERNFYAFPASYGRDRCEYIAFYRGKPVQAITHYAEVEDVIEDPEFLMQIDRIRMFPERSDEPATVFKLGNLTELNTPVESDGHWIQGAMYRDIDLVRSAKFISELL